MQNRYAQYNWKHECCYILRIIQVEKKLAKGKSLEIIADECEEKISVIRALINEIRAE